ncbi:MAG: class I adenylate-forming enzyme family protein [Acidobacteriota bacterium]
MRSSFSVLAAAGEVPERPALIDHGVEVSFGRLAERVRGRMEILRRLGLAGSKAPVAMVGEATCAALELLYALIELEVPVAMVHPRLAERDLARWLADTGAASVLDPAMVDPVVLDPAALNPEDSAPAAGPPWRQEPKQGDDEQPLAIVRTSGSSGRPKGVVLSRRAFLAAAEASAENLGWRDDDRWLLSLPIAHVGGLSIVTRCLAARRAVVVRTLERFDAARVADLVTRDRVTLLSLVPTMLGRLLELEDYRLPSHVRAILLGGAGAPPQLLRRAAEREWPVLTTYGLTEACSQVATQRYGTVNPGGRGCEPVAGMEVRIREGVVEIRGGNLMSGYLPAGDPSPFDADGWFTTGDLGRLDDQGRLHILGRRDEVIVSGGENVHPREVEEALVEHPAIEAACVFGVADPRWGEAVAAAVIASQPVDDIELVDFLRPRLAGFQRPRRIAWVETLVHLPSGKPDRRTTARQVSERLRQL